MTEILLLGSYHFMYGDKDYYSLEAQAELDALARSLMRFAPDAVAVESAAHQQDAVNAAYSKFDLRDLKNPETMRTKTLGEIRSFGDVYPVTYKNEAILIGFRMAKLAGLSEVYAVDDDSDLDDEVFDHPSPAMREAQRIESDYFARQNNDTIADSLRWWNSEEWTKIDHQIYMRANEMGDSQSYLGARTVAGWYERNLKIFSNIQRLAQRYKRIFVVYGAGHLHILRDLIRADDRLRLADVMEYLPKSK